MTSKKEMVFAPSSSAMVNDESVNDLIAAGSMGNDVDVTFLKYSQNGQWLYGADEDVLDSGEVLYIDASTFVAGSILWEGGQVKDEDCQPFSQRANIRMIEGADAFLGVNMRAVEDGKDFSYKPSSLGGKKFIQKLMLEVGLGLKAHGNDKIAMVTLDGGSYKNKKHGGKTFFPTFAIVGWAGPDGVEIKKLAA